MGEPIKEVLRQALMLAKAQKPGDRSERDRLCAIVITEIEKAQALAEAWDL